MVSWPHFGPPFGKVAPTATTNFSITAARAKVMANTETEAEAETPASNNHCQLANGTFCA